METGRKKLAEKLRDCLSCPSGLCPEGVGEANPDIMAFLGRSL